MAREITVCGDIAFVPLTKGYSAIIDAADACLISGVSWRARSGRNTVYAQRNFRRSGAHFTMCLHRVLLNAPDGVFVDHVDGDGLNNRRSNLRLCSRSQNAQNQGAPPSNRSGIKGVCWNDQDQRWRAQIQVRPWFRLHLGSFSDKTEAAAAYAKAALKYHGEFARLSNPYLDGAA